MRFSLPAIPDKNNDCGDQWKTGSRIVLDVSGKLKGIILRNVIFFSCIVKSNQSDIDC